jgi:hypothetical protein
MPLAFGKSSLWQDNMAIHDSQRLGRPDDASLAAEDDAVVAAIQAAVDDAIEAHRRDGDPIVVCDDEGNVHWIPADEIEPRKLPNDQ